MEAVKAGKQRGIFGLPRLHGHISSDASFPEDINRRGWHCQSWAAPSLCGTVRCSTEEMTALEYHLWGFCSDEVRSLLCA